MSSVTKKTRGACPDRITVFAAFGNPKDWIVEVERESGGRLDKILSKSFLFSSGTIPF
jgi:hypothetical protein